MVAPSHSSEALRTLVELKGEFQRFGVSNLWLFGSRARGEGGPKSDWDVLVEFDGVPSFGSFMGLKCFLEDHLGGRVDLLSRSACNRPTGTLVVPGGHRKPAALEGGG